MSKLTLDCLMEVLRDASNDKNTLVHIATDLGLSSTHPGILCDKIRKMKAKAEDYDNAQESIMRLKNMLCGVREALGFKPSEDILTCATKLKKETLELRDKVVQLKTELELHLKRKSSIPELQIVIDNLMKENLNLRIDNSKLEFEILVHKKNQGK